MTKEALKLALEALEEYVNVVVSVNDPNEWTPKVADAGEPARKAITAIKEALAQPEQEPVAWVGLDLDNMAEAFHRVIEEHHSRKNPFHDPVNGDAMIALRELRGLIAYMKRNTTPLQRTWVGLTLDERIELAKDVDWPVGAYCEYAEKIEAKLKEKNELR